MSDKPKEIQWIPLESNPEVLNKWAKSAGLITSQDIFQDIYGLDPELLGMVPQPVKAVVLLFPLTDALKAKNEEEDSKFVKKELEEVDPTIIWIPQKIDNACGTIGLLHSLINSRTTISPSDGSPDGPPSLADFIERCKEITPEERAGLLVDPKSRFASLFAKIHADAATSGQSAVPTNLDTNLHFTCFVMAPSVESRESNVKGAGGHRLIELDGRRKGPLDRGPCEDLLKDAAEFIKTYYISQSTDIQFNMMALAPPL
ncbi:peptidase C12, ubiquitin carboxyl-terminal hydrolase 1 [Rickenella mellea]|uniref:Ubiquitin carboxyl-terminal hydrolase n=1 Tax=Rickenella mellea TaxID=50990 RepID=A0A4Y7QHM1_9AGAM|nr:peptidase C12, ubiquitin carboxyl-terminal hydrolase 1 [Rickenella mellea]